MIRQVAVRQQQQVQSRSASRMPSHRWGIERRKSQRPAMQYPIEYRVAGSLRWRQGVCQNMGGGGVGVVIAEPLKERTTLELLLLLTSIPPLRATGQVRWQNALSAGRWLVGVQFLTIDEPQRFMDALCECLLESKLEHRGMIGKTQRLRQPW